MVIVMVRVRIRIRVTAMIMFIVRVRLPVQGRVAARRASGSHPLDPRICLDLTCLVLK